MIRVLGSRKVENWLRLRKKCMSADGSNKFWEVLSGSLFFLGSVPKVCCKTDFFFSQNSQMSQSCFHISILSLLIDFLDYC
jgi:hypothetical protein